MKKPIILVTGSAQGIGREICISFARQGATIVALDIDAIANKVTQDAVIEAGGICYAYSCNIGDKAAVRAVFDDLDGKIDHLDLLVNNAAVFNDTSLKGGDWEQQTTAFDIAMDACVMGAFYCSAAAVHLLAKATQSNIINILTNHVKDGYLLTGKPFTGYDCAKLSLLRLTETWAVELKDQGTRVNGLCFGATDTPMLRQFAPTKVETSMSVGDIDMALRYVLNQGPSGDTGQAYDFGMSETPIHNSAAEIEALRVPIANT